MTEIEELIKQAERKLKRWRKLVPGEGRSPSHRSWQEILEDKPYPQLDKTRM